VISSAGLSQDPDLSSAIEAADAVEVGEVEAELSLALQRDGSAGREDVLQAVEHALNKTES